MSWWVCERTLALSTPLILEFQGATWTRRQVATSSSALGKTWSAQLAMCRSMRTWATSFRGGTTFSRSATSCSTLPWASCPGNSRTHAASQRVSKSWDASRHRTPPSSSARSYHLSFATTLSTAARYNSLRNLTMSIFVAWWRIWLLQRVSILKMASLTGALSWKCYPISRLPRIQPSGNSNKSRLIRAGIWRISGKTMLALTRLPKRPKTIVLTVCRR